MARHTYDMRCAAATALAMLCLDQAALGKPEFREAFFAAYPGAVNTVLDTVPSFPNHCGVCRRIPMAGEMRFCPSEVWIRIMTGPTPLTR